MENREAIASLKTLCNTCTMFPKCVNSKPECFQAIETAISALEKQKPKTVRTQFDRWHNYFLHFCPVCGGLVREYEYCSDCGQKLSYEEDTEDDRDTRM